MKLDVAGSVASLLSLLACAPACDGGKPSPQGSDAAAREAEGEGDAKAGDAKAGDAKAGDAKAGDAKAGDAKAGDAKAGDAKAGDAKAGDAKAGDAKAGDAKAGSIADVVADAKAADAKAAEAAAAGTDAKAEPTADPKAPARPGVAITSLYWASANTEAGKTEIDIIDSSHGEALMKLSDAHGNPDGIHTAFPPDVKLPGGFALGDEWVVATTTGEARGKAVGYGAYGGASEGHFIVALDTLVTGLAARAGEWTGPIPTLREVARVDMTKGPGKALFQGMKKSLPGMTEPEAKKALARKPITAKHVVAIEGRFPNGYTHLVTIVRPIAPADEIASEHVAGMVLTDATGRVEAVSPLVLTINSDELVYLVDLEGDGIDEVVYDDSYYEGSYRMLLTWTAAGRPAVRTLTGDGA